MKNPIKNRLMRTVLIGLMASLVAISLYVLNVFSFLEYKTYDSRIVSFAGLNKPSEEIVYVQLDQESLDWAQKERGWSWPWPRSAYGDIVSFFAQAKAQSLSFDVLFTEPSVYGAADDEYFAQKSRDYAHVIQTVFFSSQYANTHDWPSYLPEPQLKLEGFSSSFLESMTKGEGALFPIPQLASSASSLGVITSIKDADGIIRRSRLFYPFEGKNIPAFGLAALVADNKQPVFTLNTQQSSVSFMDKQIPVDKNGAVLLRYRGSLDSYIPYNAKQILLSLEAVKAGKEPLLDPASFEGSRVFFAFYAPGLFDICSTPISSVYPGVGVHITLLDNFLQNDFIQAPPAWLSVLLIIIFTMLTSLVVYVSDTHPFVRKASLPTSIVLLLILIVILFSLVYGTFILGYWLPLVAPLFGIFLSFLANVLVSYATEGKQKRYLKSAFKQYLSPVVIEQLIAHPERLKLGGERREISIFFSDVQGFTSISERLTPEALTELLNDYLSAMSDIILDTGGTIDKYEGDAIIAFWNAPTSHEDHALRALTAALACQKKLAEMGPELQVRAGMPMLMRIGLNTGNAVVGNMGSHNRFDYTMLGDSVNLAARLEGLNKQFGSYTMCTAAMKNHAQNSGCTLHFREIARVAVVGKKEAVTVFEPMEVAEFEQKKDTLEQFDMARNLFYEGAFIQAIKIFDSIAETDKPAKFYSEKCKELIANPPTDWAGVWQATSK